MSSTPPVPKEVRIPAVCTKCGLIFPSDIVVGEGGSARFTGINTGGYCPRCGGSSRIEEGFYEFVDDAEQIFAAWSPKRRKQLSEDLADARANRDDAAALKAISDAPGLGSALKKYLAPKSASDVWAIVSVLLTILSIYMSTHQGTTTNDIKANQTIIEKQVIQKTEPEPAHRIDSPPRSHDHPKSSKGKARRQRGGNNR